MEHGVVKEDQCSTFITSSFSEAAEQKAERPRKYKVLQFSSLCEHFQY